MTMPSTVPVFDEQTAQKLQKLFYFQEMQNCFSVIALSAAVVAFSEDFFIKAL